MKALEYLIGLGYLPLTAENLKMAPEADIGVDFDKLPPELQERVTAAIKQTDKKTWDYEEDENIADESESLDEPADIERIEKTLENTRKQGFEDVGDIAVEKGKITSVKVYKTRLLLVSESYIVPLNLEVIPLKDRIAILETELEEVQDSGTWPNYSADQFKQMVELRQKIEVLKKAQP